MVRALDRAWWLANGRMFQWKDAPDEEYTAATILDRWMRASWLPKPPATHAWRALDYCMQRDIDDLCGVFVRSTPAKDVMRGWIVAWYHAKGKSVPRRVSGLERAFRWICGRIFRWRGAPYDEYKASDLEFIFRQVYGSMLLWSGAPYEERTAETVVDAWVRASWLPDTLVNLERWKPDRRGWVGWWSDLSINTDWRKIDRLMQRDVDCLCDAFIRSRAANTIIRSWIVDWYRLRGIIFPYWPNW
jgi:hypothetical protein